MHVVSVFLISLKLPVQTFESGNKSKITHEKLLLVEV